MDALPPLQSHLLAFWDQLDDVGRESLAEGIRRIDFELIDRLFRHKDDEGNVREMVATAEAPPAIRLDAAENAFKAEDARREGQRALAAGDLGVILVAGGQGTRLGFKHPKGMFPIGPVSGRTLFQLHVEKIVAAAQRYGVRIPLYLMTSPATHEETVRFFQDNDRFGLPQDDLQVFCQGTMPAVDATTGKILLDAPDRIATSPDGHGGLLAALANGGILDDFDRRGIRQLFYFQVDNPLVDICGPEFIGYHLLAKSEMSTQVVAKQTPFDRVGNAVKVSETLRVIEYSDLPDDVAQRRNPDGSLAIWAGSIAVHVIDAALFQRAAGDAASLPFHLAHKKVAHVDPTGRRIEPQQPNAIKFERFIFDLIPLAANAIVVEVDPPDAFAPLKNAPGAERDTAQWVQAQMIAQHRRWLRQAGAEVADGVAVEICPLLALDPEELAQRLPPETSVTAPKYFVPSTPV